ncbi:DUF87 domain-containing protein [Candidatus Micrarchaeota archaeon]|nr:DUF87 domain-containing protein [Candidatus Micrarchaeota archaeon]
MGVLEWFGLGCGSGGGGGVPFGRVVEPSVVVGDCMSMLVRREEGGEFARYAGAFVSSRVYRGLQAARARSEWEWREGGGLVEWVYGRAPALHTLITGASGSGKSTLAKSLVLQFARVFGVVVIDPHGEFGGVVESVGGRVFSSSEVSLSLFELERGVSPAEKVGEAVGIIRAAMPSMGDQQAYYLGKCALAAYASRGFTSERSSWQRRPPSLADVAVELDGLLSSGRRVDASLFSLKRRLDSLVLSGVFGAKTQLPFSVVVSAPSCFDMSGIRSREAQVIFVEVFLRKLYAYCQREGVGRELVAVIDEAQSLCRSSEDFTSFAGAVAAGGRKFRIGLVVLAQGFEGLDPAIAANASAVFTFFSREPGDCEYAAGLHAGAKYGFKAQAVLDELHSLAPHECLFSCTGSSGLVRVAVRAPGEFVAGERRPFVLGSRHQLFFFEKLRGFLSGERVVYNDWNALPGYELDMTLPERKIAIELDGVFFHDVPEQKERDERKDALLVEKGWKVVRVRDDGLSFKELEGRAREVAGSLGLLA